MPFRSLSLASSVSLLLHSVKRSCPLRLLALSSFLLTSATWRDTRFLIFLHSGSGKYSLLAHGICFLRRSLRSASLWTLILLLNSRSSGSCSVRLDVGRVAAFFFEIFYGYLSSDEAASEAYCFCINGRRSFLKPAPFSSRFVSISRCVRLSPPIFSEAADFLLLDRLYRSFEGKAHLLGRGE